MAAEQGKFFEMITRQLDLQKSGFRPLSLDELHTIAQEISLDGDVMIKRIKNGAYRREIWLHRQKAMKEGVTSVPTILINGRFADASSESCLTKLIDEALESATE